MRKILWSASRRPAYRGAAYRIVAAAGAALAPAWALSSELSREDIQWLDRVAYGASTAPVDEYLKLGRRRFLNEQLHPQDLRLPEPAADQIAALDISHS